MVPTVVYEENRKFSHQNMSLLSNKNEDLKMNWANQKQKNQFLFSFEQKQAG